MKRDDEWIPLAQVARPHGVRGEVRLKLFNKDSDLLLDAEEVGVRLADGTEHEITVTGARRADDAILMKFHSVETRDRADELRDALISLRRRAFPALAEDEFYACDIEGADVVMEDGQLVGKVREFLSYPSVDALRIRPEGGGKEFEVPLTTAYVEKVDVGGNVVRLVTLDGIPRE